MSYDIGWIVIPKAMKLSKKTWKYLKERGTLINP